jgi:hypothetical protein
LRDKIPVRAGILEDGSVTVSDRGTGQGACRRMMEALIAGAYSRNLVFQAALDPDWGHLTIKIS